MDMKYRNRTCNKIEIDMQYNYLVAM